MRRAVFRLAVLLSSALVARSLMAQTTIFNIPTTDTVANGKTYFEIDFLPQIPKPDFANRAYTYNPRLVVGVTSDVEAGVNVPFFHTAPTTTAFLVPNVNGDSSMTPRTGSLPPPAEFCLRGRIIARENRFTGFSTSPRLLPRLPQCSNDKRRH